MAYLRTCSTPVVHRIAAALLSLLQMFELGQHLLAAHIDAVQLVGVLFIPGANSKRDGCEDARPSNVKKHMRHDAIGANKVQLQLTGGQSCWVSSEVARQAMVHWQSPACSEACMPRPWGACILAHSSLKRALVQVPVPVPVPALVLVLALVQDEGVAGHTLKISREQGQVQLLEPDSKRPRHRA